MLFKEGLPGLKLSKNEKKYRIHDILQQIKDCIVKVYLVLRRESTIKDGNRLPNITSKTNPP